MCAYDAESGSGPFCNMEAENSSHKEHIKKSEITFLFQD